jgi:hypothetical protein
VKLEPKKYDKNNKPRRQKRKSAKLKALRSIDAEEKRRILVKHCLEMEQMGPREGQAKLRVIGALYDPQVVEYHRVPGKVISVLIDSAEALEEAFDVMEEGLRAWAKGRWADGKFQCQCGRRL